MSSRSHFTVIAVAISIVYFMAEHVQGHGSCATELKNFGYDGKLHHDTHNFTFTIVDSAKSLPGYRAFVDYIDDKIFSTNTDLVNTYCDTVEFLFEKGFTGALPIDRAISDKEESGRSAQENEYISFVTSEPYKGITDKSKQLIFDLVYEYGFSKLEVTKEGAECKNTLKTLDYNGNFVHDILILRKKNPEFKGLRNDVDRTKVIEKKEKAKLDYESFMVYAKNFVLLTDNNIMNVFCDLLDTLKIGGFNGNREHDLKKFENMLDENNTKESNTSENTLLEEATVYNGYLTRVDLNIYEKADVQKPQSLLATFGLHKLGKIMY